MTNRIFSDTAFDSPTSWGFETTTFLFGVHFMMALSYAQKHDSHVAIDVFEMRLAPRARTILRIITAILIFVPTIGLLTAWSIKYAVTSWQQWELASSSWAPPVYPFKTIMAIGFVLWFLQGIARLLQDIAGGLMVTAPSAKDMTDPKVKAYLEKYLAGSPDVNMENRMKMMRLIETMTLGASAVGYLVESLHGAGSPQAQRIMIGRLSNLEAKKKLAKTLALIEEDGE